MKYILLVLAAVLPLCSCSSRHVVVTDCKPRPIDDCTPPDCYGGGVECSWEITSNVQGGLRFVADGVTSSDRFMGAIVVTKGETVRTPGVEFKGATIPTDDLLSDPQKTVLRNELLTRSLFDPNTQTIAYFRTTNPVGLEDGVGKIVIQTERFSGTLLGVGTLESDVNDGPPLDQLQVFADTVDMPVADAGGPYATECAGARTAVHLDGTKSHTTRSGTLSYAWFCSCPGSSFDDASSATPTLTIDTSSGCGQSCDVRLIVTEGVLSTAANVVVKITDTTAPVVEVAAIAPVGVGSNCEFLVPFSAIVADNCNVAAAKVKVTVTNPSANATLGPPTITKTQTQQNRVDVSGTVLVSALTSCPAVVRVDVAANDVCGNPAASSSTAQVSDNTAPKIAVKLDPNVLRPPNHDLISIAATVDVIDNCPGVTYVLTSVTSNEPANGLGDGDVSPDIVGAVTGTPDTQFLLRAERSGTGSGRTYTVVYTATDPCGNSAAATAEVRVPLGRGTPVTLAADVLPGQPAPSARIEDRIFVTRFYGVRPNPFFGSTTLEYEMGTAGNVRLVVCDLSGRTVRVVESAWETAGRHQQRWDGLDNLGRPVPPGIYLVHFITNGATSTSKRLVRLP